MDADEEKSFFRASLTRVIFGEWYWQITASPWIRGLWGALLALFVLYYADRLLFGVEAPAAIDGTIIGAVTILTYVSLVADGYNRKRK